MAPVAMKMKSRRVGSELSVADDMGYLSSHTPESRADAHFPVRTAACFGIGLEESLAIKCRSKGRHFGRGSA
jgi:hypothetical protein